ncbi:MAG TPA: zinc ribbon domain-containing protein [Candidatus Bathyarchaeia archaeon]|nr:zinc ribbon domain-containing protein [Candidatus Bathyarchaeia archaeon]
MWEGSISFGLVNIPLFSHRRQGIPYFKFTEYLTYKAALAGIKVIKIFEKWTSQTCRRCNQLRTRVLLLAQTGVQW